MSISVSKSIEIVRLSPENDDVVIRELMESGRTLADQIERLQAWQEEVRRRLDELCLFVDPDWDMTGGHEVDRITVLADRFRRQRAEIGRLREIVDRPPKTEAHLEQQDECTYCGEPLKLDEKQMFGMHVHCASMDRADHDIDRAKDER